MAISLYFLAVFYVLFCFLPTSLEDDDTCKEQIDMVVDCWIHYGDPPSCKRKSSMVLCAEERFDSVLNCSKTTLNKIKRMVYSYGTMEAILCEETSDLLTEIEIQKSCWPILRSCALQVLMVEPNSVKECKGVMSVLTVCSLISHSCSNVYTPFINSILDKSTCSDYIIPDEEEIPAKNPLQQFIKNKTDKISVTHVTLFLLIFISFNFYCPIHNCYSY